MGKGFWQRLNWMTVTVVFAFLLGVSNTLMISFKPKEVSICVVDLWSISLKKSLEITGIDAPKNKTEEEIKKEADIYMDSIKAELSNPKQFGCDYIALKGAIVGGYTKDITEQVVGHVK